MGISVNVNPKLVSELNALIDGKRYRTRDEAVEDAIRCTKQIYHYSN
jgi:metal-responsive CopG/Arc/MetJ family transcriptional regulator